jgi:hypothetical protein
MGRLNQTLIPFFGIDVLGFMVLELGFKSFGKFFSSAYIDMSLC